MSDAADRAASQAPIRHIDQVRGIDSDPKELDPFRPLHPNCERITVAKPKSDDEWRRIAALREGRPDVRLYLWGVPATNLEMLRFFPDLRRLTVHVPNLESLVGLRHVQTSLRELALNPGKSRPSVKPIALCTDMQSLHLTGGSRDFDSLHALRKLGALGLGGHSMADLSALSPFRRLRSLYLGFCDPIDFQRLDQFPELEGIHIQKMNKLQSLSGLEVATRLKRIELGWLPRVESLPRLAGLLHLDEFEVSGMKSLRDVDGVAAGPALRYLALWDCQSLTPESFRCFVGHPALKHVEWGIGAKKKNDAVGAMFPQALKGSVPYRITPGSVLRRPTP